MKINEVRELSTSELKEKLYSLKEQLFELRRKKAVGALERGEDVITVRKDMMSSRPISSKLVISSMSSVQAKVMVIPVLSNVGINTLVQKVMVPVTTEVKVPSPITVVTTTASCQVNTCPVTTVMNPQQCSTN